MTPPRTTRSEENLDRVVNTSENLPMVAMLW